MVGWLRHVAQPVVRLTTMHEVEHEKVFEEFAQLTAQAALEERVKHEPRVVSFRQRRGVL